MANPTFIPSPYPAPNATPAAVTGLRPGLEAYRQGLHSQAPMLDPKIRAEMEKNYLDSLNAINGEIQDARNSVMDAYVKRYGAAADEAAKLAAAMADYAKANAMDDQAKADMYGLKQKAMDLSAAYRQLEGNAALVDEFNKTAYGREAPSNEARAKALDDVKLNGGLLIHDKASDQLYPNPKAIDAVYNAVYAKTIQDVRDEVTRSFETNPADPKRVATLNQEADIVASRMADAVARGDLTSPDMFPPGTSPEEMQQANQYIAKQFAQKVKTDVTSGVLSADELARYGQAQQVAENTNREFDAAYNKFGAGNAGLKQSLGAQKTALDDMAKLTVGGVADQMAVMQVPQQLLDDRQMVLDRLNNLDTRPPNPYEQEMARIQANPLYRDVFNALGFRNHDQAAEWMASNPDAAIQAFQVANRLKVSDPSFHTSDLKDAYKEEDVRGRTGLQRAGQYLANQITGGPGFVATGNEPTYQPKAAAPPTTEMPPARLENESDEDYGKRVVAWGQERTRLSNEKKAEANVNAALNDPQGPNPSYQERAKAREAIKTDEERDETNVQSQKLAAQQAADRAKNVKLEPVLQVPSPPTGNTTTLAVAPPSPGQGPGPNPRTPARPDWLKGLASSFGSSGQGA